ncbi:MAG TPA: PAS domain S-box protein [Longimicrobiales bacterium]|nr:PAS domain S-box protein [Longimicrobiales bacterium]
MSEHARQRAEKALRLNEEGFRLLVQSVKDYGIFMLDPTGHVASWNEGAERINGYRAEEILGRHFSVFYPPEAATSGFPQHELDVAAATGRFEDEGWRVRKDGSHFWSNVVITALRDEEGTLVGFAKVTRDLTERRKAEEQARRLAAEEAARTEADRRSAELARLNEQLQEQAVELEYQNEESQALTEELERTNEELEAAVRAAEAGRDAARSAERFTTDILASIPDPFVVYDESWHFRYVNPRAARMFRESPERAPADLVGAVVWDIYPELAGSPLQQAMLEAMATREPVQREIFSAERGAWIEVHCYPLPDGGLAASWRDITERKQAEEALHFLAEASAILSSSLDYEQTLAAVARLAVPQLADWCAIDVAGDGGKIERIAVAHVDPRKVALARQLEERYPSDLTAPRGPAHVIRTGRSELYPEIPDEMLVAGMKDEEHLRIARELGLRSAMVVPLVTGREVLGAMTLVSAESGRRYGEADLRLAEEVARRAGLAVENARLHRDSLAAKDAAERAAAEAEAAAEEAAQANTAKTDFLRVMSHELRTPLNAIGGYAELLELGIHGPVTDAQIEALSRIRRSQRHLLSLINDVLNFAKLEAGHLEIASVPVRVNDVLSGLEGMIAPQLRAGGAAYAYLPSPDDLVVRADREKLEQILLNLLSNAVKFTPAGGRIEVSAARVGNAAAIRVTDTGVGIPADKLDAVFEPFVQVSRGPSGGHGGTGLGLSISRDLAHAMHGDLTVQSVVGQGSTFTLTLPLARD